ncbi:beta-lactamase [Elysia marginata]|uniref:Beta-lactamase n=1 Tax=Elysia marginata TaxID=1093978 RepID=A0AAV4ELI8_9GAST|nr:beta-lactamase [Elysia marginata]
MNLYPIDAGNFKLDGGAMFGVVPKSIWQRTNPADSNNMIDLATRCLLVEDGNRLTLIDTGMGNKQDDKFFGYYYLWGALNIDKSLAKYGFHRDDITDVLLTHLHFDHCGGCIQWNKDRTGYEPAFKNAKFWTNKKHWEWATKPNVREAPSFRKENLSPMEISGQLHFVGVDEGSTLVKTNLGFDVMLVDGHTEKQMLPIIKYKGKTGVYVADLVPTLGHLPIAYVMGFDVRPLLSLEEKERFLKMAVENDYLLVFGHDAHNEVCSLTQTERGVRHDQTYTFAEVFA